jgi:hypothetical protein
MNKSLLLTIISFAIAIIGLILFFASVDKGAMVDFSLLILVVTVALALTFSVGSILKDPQVLKRVLLGVGVLLVLFILSYLLAGDGEVRNGAGNLLVGAGSTSKWVGAGVNYSIILLIIGGGLFFWDMIKNVAK